MTKQEKRNETLSKVVRAKTEISIAEKELKEVIGELPLNARANKTQINKALDDAFRNLRAAKARVTELEALLDAAEKTSGD